MRKNADFVLGIITCEAQNNTITGFLPEGHVLYKEYNGDLNKDGKEDCIIITKKTNEDSIVIFGLGRLGFLFI